MEMYRLLWLLLLNSLAWADEDAYSQNERVRKKLLKDYDRMALPHRDQNGTTTVTVGFTINGMWFDEPKQVLHLHSWMTFVWDDPRLKWDYKDYGGLKSVHVDQKEVWTPDFALYNSADNDLLHFGSVNLLAYHDGMVLWVPPAMFSSECAMDFTYWPYDTQFCELVFGSWTTHGWQVDLDIYMNMTRPLLGWFAKYSHMWQYTGGRTYKIDDQYSVARYVMIVLEVDLKRNSPSYASTVIVPALVISLLTLVQFLLPMQESKRVSVGCTAALLTLITLFYTAWSVPSLAWSTPIIIKYYGQTLVVVMLSVGVSAGVLRLCDASQPGVSTPPPALIKNLLTGPLGSIMLLQKYMGKVGHSGGAGEDGEVLEGPASPSYVHEWLLVAAAVDRLALLAFTATFVITLFAYVAVL